MTKWTEWKAVGDGKTEVAPVAVAFMGKLYVFVKATGENDRKIYMTSSADGENWVKWDEMKAKGESGPATDMSPTATVLGNTLYVFINGLTPNNKTTYVSSTTDGTSWTAWSEVSGHEKTNLAPAAAALKVNGADTLFVFVKGDDNKIHCAKGT